MSFLDTYYNSHPEEKEILNLKRKLSDAMDELVVKNFEVKQLTEQNARLRHSLSIQDTNNDLRKTK